MALRFSLVAIFCALLPGCLPRDRLNAACQWLDDPPRALDLGRRADRKHLELDVRLAEDLGIRYGDAVGGRVSSEGNLRPRAECTASLLAALPGLHGVKRADVARATGARDPGLDATLVFLPMLVLFGVAASRVTGRVDRAFEPDERWLKLLALVLLAVVVSAVGVVAVELWSWIVESARLRNSHISYRAFRLPVVRHRLACWIGAMIVFACIAAARSHARRSSRADGS
jgi:hypothetical protein